MKHTTNPNWRTQARLALPPYRLDSAALVTFNLAFPLLLKKHSQRIVLVMRRRDIQCTYSA